ncbi:MAG: hypothetical protein BWY09_01471 [Candidatus Hydrogenedentes bacterium ADurb.Bin179]|nr:MAG: hypothetical protein BWY09_01471 [Candidatus Hydrogenedentes bacterium ADurb.Bin179]
MAVPFRQGENAGRGAVGSALAWLVVLGCVRYFHCPGTGLSRRKHAAAGIGVGCGFVGVGSVSLSQRPALVIRGIGAFGRTRGRARPAAICRSGAGTLSRVSRIRPARLFRVWQPESAGRIYGVQPCAARLPLHPFQTPPLPNYAAVRRGVCGTAGRVAGLRHAQRLAGRGCERPFSALSARWPRPPA